MRTTAARHVAVVADGNRRWARAHGLGVQEGHEAGADTLRARLYDALELGVEERRLRDRRFGGARWSHTIARPQVLRDWSSERSTTRDA